MYLPLKVVISQCHVTFQGGIGRLVTFSRVGYIFGEHYLTCHHSQMFHCSSYRGVTMKIEQLAPCSPLISCSICSSFSMKSDDPGCSRACHNRHNPGTSVIQCQSSCVAVPQSLHPGVCKFNFLVGKVGEFPKKGFFKLSNRSLDMCASEITYCRKCICTLIYTSFLSILL